MIILATDFIIYSLVEQISVASFIYLFTDFFSKLI